MITCRKELQRITFLCNFPENLSAMRKSLSICFSFLFFVLGVVNDSFSQRFAGNPPSLKWKQINTDTARIIFPEGLDSQAQRVSSLVHYLASQRPIALGDKLYKINIVLQNQ